MTALLAVLGFALAYAGALVLLSARLLQFLKPSEVPAALLACAAGRHRRLAFILASRRHRRLAFILASRRHAFQGPPWPRWPLRWRQFRCLCMTCRRAGSGALTAFSPGAGAMNPERTADDVTDDLETLAVASITTPDTKDRTALAVRGLVDELCALVREDERLKGRKAALSGSGRLRAWLPGQRHG